MSVTYQQLLQKWSSLTTDECLTTDSFYKFKVRILPSIANCKCNNAWRLVTSDNIAWRLANDQSTVLIQLNFVLLTVMHHCAVRYSNISFTFAPGGTTTVICNGLQSQPHLHPAIAALDAYIQLLEF